MELLSFQKMYGLCRYLLKVKALAPINARSLLADVWYLKSTFGQYRQTKTHWGKNVWFSQFLLILVSCWLLGNGVVFVSYVTIHPLLTPCSLLRNSSFTCTWFSFWQYLHNCRTQFWLLLFLTICIKIQHKTRWFLSDASAPKWTSSDQHPGKEGYLLVSIYFLWRRWERRQTFLRWGL